MRLPLGRCSGSGSSRVLREGVGVWRHAVECFKRGSSQMFGGRVDGYSFL